MADVVSWRNLFGKAAIQNPDKPSIATLDSSIVDRVEDQVAKFRDVAGYRSLAPYVKGLALDLALFNAKVFASVPLRLYAPAKAGGGVLKGLETKKVNRRIAKHLRNPAAVSSKAVMRAEQAGDVVEVLYHPALELARRPDPSGTGMGWLLLYWINKQLYGEALLLKIAGSSGIVAAPHLQPQWSEVQPDKERGISGWYYGRDKTDRRAYDADAVWQMKWANSPYNPYRGLGWLELATREIEIEDHALASELERWRNGGYPEGVLAFANAKNQEQLDSAIDSFYRMLKRARKRGGVVATSDAKYTPLSIASEMNYVPGLELVERRMMNRAGVPEAIYKMNDANRASSYAADPAYARYTVGPALAVDAEQWSELVLPDFGVEPGSMWFAYDPFGDADLDGLRQDVVYVTSGVKTINEHRAELGLDPFDNPLANQLLVNGQPLGQSTAPAAPFGGMFLSAPSHMTAPATPAVADKREPPEPPEPAEPAPADEPPKPPVLLSGKAWCDSDPYFAGCHIHTKDDDRLNLPNETVSKIEQVVREWIEAAGRAVTADAILRGVSLSGMDAALEAALEPLVADLFRVGASEGFASIGVDDADLFEVVPERALEAVRRHNSLIVEQIRGTTEDGIRGAIEASLEQGLSTSETQRLVQAAVTDAAPWRAEAVARTESANANMAGSQAAWIHAGVEKKRWLLAPDACSICRAMVAKIGGEGLESKGIGIDAPFVKAGTLIVGDDGRKYMPRLDVFHPPLHPNDRCAMVAEIEEASE